MDLAQFSGEEYREVVLDGEVFRVGELTLADWGPVQAWIKAKVPGPLSSLDSPDFHKLPPSVKRDIIAEALRQDRAGWPPMLGSRGWFEALDHPGGHAEVLRAILSKHRPGLTVERCEAIAKAASFAEILPCLTAALGLFDPKSPAPSTPTSPTPTGPTTPDAGTTSATSPTAWPSPGAGPSPTSSA